MGQVYRARDTELHRDVAIKVLAPEFASDADRVVRFAREARVLASLNHPNIAHIHGLQRSGHVTAIVMELAEGETLADRIARGPIAVVEALPITRQIIEALEAAHEQGVIHRDLKPANIQLRADGTVKVLDFGLAKTVQETSDDAEDARNPGALSSLPGWFSERPPTCRLNKPGRKRSTAVWTCGRSDASCSRCSRGSRRFEAARDRRTVQGGRGRSRLEVLTFIHTVSHSPIAAALPREGR